MNPTYSEKNLQDVEENLSLLIKQKDKFYPDVRIQIVDVHIKEINGKHHITVTSMNVE
jgi:signal recognition particle subunit SEC65